MNLYAKNNKNIPKNSIVMAILTNTLIHLSKIIYYIEYFLLCRIIIILKVIYSRTLITRTLIAQTPWIIETIYFCSDVSFVCRIYPLVTGTTHNYCNNPKYWGS